MPKNLFYIKLISLFGLLVLSFYCGTRSMKYQVPSYDTIEVHDTIVRTLPLTGKHEINLDSLIARDTLIYHYKDSIVFNVIDSINVIDSTVYSVLPVRGKVYHFTRSDSILSLDFNIITEGLLHKFDYTYTVLQKQTIITNNRTITKHIPSDISKFGLLVGLEYNNILAKNNSQYLGLKFGIKTKNDFIYNIALYKSLSAEPARFGFGVSKLIKL